VPKLKVYYKKEKMYTFGISKFSQRCQQKLF